MEELDSSYAINDARYPEVDCPVSLPGWKNLKMLSGRTVSFGGVTDSSGGTGSFPPDSLAIVLHLACHSFCKLTF